MTISFFIILIGLFFLGTLLVIMVSHWTILIIHFGPFKYFLSTFNKRNLAEAPQKDSEPVTTPHVSKQDTEAIVTLENTTKMPDSVK